MKKLLNDIEEKGMMTKRELITQRWGSGIKFTPYRRALMKHPNVSDRRQRIPAYVWVDEKDKKSKESACFLRFCTVISYIEIKQ